MNKTWYLRLFLKVLLGLVVLYALYLAWAVIAFGGGCGRMQGEIHYIPAGYIGKVYIIFDEREGAEKEYLGNRRVYRIPRSGILRTKFDVNLGWIDYEKQIDFYYCSATDTTEIQKFNPYKENEDVLDSTVVIIMEYGNGSGWLYQGHDKTILSYIVDSLRNFDKGIYKLTPEMYERWRE